MKVHYYSSMTKITVTDGKQEFTVLYFKKNEIDESLPIIVTGTIEIDKDIVIIANTISSGVRNNKIEISSYSKCSLGRSLTNVHYNSTNGSIFDIDVDGLKHPSDVKLKNSYRTYFNKFGCSVEGWYKANSSSETLGEVDDIFDFNLMVKLICIKLKTYGLLNKITCDLLQYSTHNVGNGRWSSRGGNMFMESLKSAFISELYGTKTTKTNNGYVRVSCHPSFIDNNSHVLMRDKLEKMFDKYNCITWKNGKHKAIAFGDVEYKYTGAVHKQQGLDSEDKTMISNILNRASSLVGKPYNYYNHILINRFDNYGIGTHTDDEKIYRDENDCVGSVLIVSIGNTFAPHTIDGVEFVATNGSVIEMSTGSLRHSVGRSDGIRYSITFRHIPSKLDIC